MHQARRRRRIVERRFVLRRAIIPHHQIIFTPIVKVGERGLHTMRGEFGDQVAALVLRHADNARRVAFGNIKTLTAIHWMHTHQQMNGFWIGFDGRVVIFFDTGFHRLGEAMHDALQCLQTFEAFFHGLWQRFVRGGGAGEVGVAERAAVYRRHFERAQRGDRMRIGSCRYTGRLF